MKNFKSAAFLLLFFFFTSCAVINFPETNSDQQAAIEPTVAPTKNIPEKVETTDGETQIMVTPLVEKTLLETHTPPPPTLTPPPPTFTPTQGPSPTLSETAWQSMPVVPDHISETTLAIYKMGQLMGNDPNAFSKVGDCNNTLPYFLEDFDNPEIYRLGEYSNLQETIDYFSDSYSRDSLAVKEGMSSGATMAVLWADWKECNSTEIPLDCEYRIHNPSFAIISVGTNDVTDVEAMQYFEDKMRRLIDLTIGKGIVPILATKADNAEGDHYINAIIARLAYEYDIPLWNFWLAAQSLPGKGLRSDSPQHLTMPDDWSQLCNFENPENLELAFPIRNLTALQVLDAVRRGVEEQTN